MRSATGELLKAGEIYVNGRTSFVVLSEPVPHSIIDLSVFILWGDGTIELSKATRFSDEIKQ